MKKELENFNLIIYGGDGDLAMKKLFPALYFRLKDGQIQKESNIYVVSINYKTQEKFID
jgi:glucose-6-phosphate 1-dehydrogenase